MTISNFEACPARIREKGARPDGDLDSDAKKFWSNHIDYGVKTGEFKREHEASLNRLARLASRIAAHDRMLETAPTTLVRKKKQQAAGEFDRLAASLGVHARASA